MVDLFYIYYVLRCACGSDTVIMGRVPLIYTFYYNELTYLGRDGSVMKFAKMLHVIVT